MIWLSLALNYAGLLAFASVMDAHRHAFPRMAARNHRVLLRIAGGVLQTAALACAIAANGIGGGLVLWIIGWATCGLTLSLFLSLRPR
ncbi:MAG: hypothetical protein K0R17_1260 [Rariglobus sp.]|jgi:hypothetical protein|nr:hypothetical protein [Rariglobus sp.]